jgi:hypothetical protein
MIQKDNEFITKDQFLSEVSDKQIIEKVEKGETVKINESTYSPLKKMNE